MRTDRSHNYKLEEQAERLHRSPGAETRWEDTPALSQTCLKVSWVLGAGQAAPTAKAALGLAQMREMQKPCQVL